jgi:hypothetical protein
MGSGKTLVKQRAVTRVIKGILAAKIKGDIEVDLATGVVRFRPTGESDAGPAKTAGKPNPWDKVLKDGKAKPALTLCKKSTVIAMESCGSTTVQPALRCLASRAASSSRPHMTPPMRAPLQPRQS